jgi:hypothetical protein
MRRLRKPVQPLWVFDRNRFFAPDRTGGGFGHELAPVGELA